MRISKVTVENYRSIQFAEVELSEFNIFIGQNNHGKTNFFEAIEWFYNGSGDLSQITFQHDPDRDVVVTVDFIGVQAGIEAVKNEKNREAFRRFAGGKDHLKVARRKSDAGKRVLWDEDKGEWSAKNFSGFDKAFNDCLPRMEFIATSIKPADISKFGKKTPIGLMLSGVLSAVLEGSERYKSFRTSFEEAFGSDDSEIRSTLNRLSGEVQAHLVQQFPDTQTVKFQLNPPVIEDLLKTFETSINDGVETTAEEKGDGMQRALMLAIIKTFADFRRSQEDLGKSFVFLIDEAELHLHPTAQRQLKEALLSLATSGDQILLNTHSSVLVADDHERQQIMSVEKRDGVTSIRIVPAQEKPRIVFDLLGGSPADLLFPRNFLIVEGASEQRFLSKVISKYYMDQPQLQIVYAEGNVERQKRSMEGINTVLVPLYGTPIYKDRLVLLCDKPSPSWIVEFNKFLACYQTLNDAGQIQVLPVEALESYYPAAWTRTPEQVKGMSGKQKTCLAEEVGEAISKEQFENEMPIIWQALTQAWEKAHV